jgi:hypothetical protein
MATPPVLDIERLLAPISVEQPTGVELTVADSDGAFANVKNAWDESKEFIREMQKNELRAGLTVKATSGGLFQNQIGALLFP